MILAKVYQNLFSTNVIVTEFVESVVKVEEDLANFDVATLEIPFFDWLSEDIKIELHEISNNIDTLIFSWFIFEIRPRFDKIGLVKITARSQKALMLKRKVLLPKNYNTTVQDILQDLIDDYNAYWEQWTLDTVYTNIINLELNVWDTYFDVINEIAEQIEAERDIIDSVVVLAWSLGEDKSTWSNYAEIVFNWRYPSNNNVKDIELIGQADRSNIVIGIDKNWNRQREVDTSDGVIYGVSVVNFRNGDLVAKTQAELAKRNVDQRTYKVLVEANTVINVNKWDTVRISISDTIDIMDVEGTTTVVKKTTMYDNATKYIDIFVSSFKKADITTTSILNDIQKQIAYLKT